MSELKQVFKNIELQQNFIGEGFINPPENDFSRVNIFGEITNLYNFTPEICYLTYEFDFPIGWKIDDENEYYEIYKNEHLIEENINKLKTISQNSYRNIIKSNVIHSINMPFELELLVYNKVINRSFPSILIQINSIDSWGRHRIEGYSHYQFSNKTKYEKIKIPCYKPIEDLSMKVFSYFLGGNKKIIDLKEISKKYNFNENNLPVALNRYGIKTEFSGYVEIGINLTIQKKEVSDYNKRVIKEKQGRMTYSISSAIDGRGKNESIINDEFSQIEKEGKEKVFQTIRTKDFGDIGRFTYK